MLALLFALFSLAFSGNIKVLEDGEPAPPPPAPKDDKMSAGSIIGVILSVLVWAVVIALSIYRRIQESRN